MLDVNTPRGQTTIQEERDAVALFTASFPNIMYVDTPKKGSATVVRRVIDLAADNSIKLELFHQALLDIATIPFSLPSGAAGIAAAKKALDKGREIDDKAA